MIVRSALGNTSGSSTGGSWYDKPLEYLQAAGGGALQAVGQKMAGGKPAPAAPAAPPVAFYPEPKKSGLSGLLDSTEGKVIALVVLAKLMKVF